MATFEILLREPNPVSLPAGKVIFSEGDAGDNLYAVIDGEVEIVRGDRVLATVAKGGVFGEMALVDDRPRSATARAKSDCRLAPVNSKRFLLLVQNSPFFALQLLRLLAERLRANTVS